MLLYTSCQKRPWIFPESACEFLFDLHMVGLTAAVFDFSRLNMNGGALSLSTQRKTLWLCSCSLDDGCESRSGVGYMKILSSCLMAVLFAVIFASPARADSTEFAISIDGSWQQNQFCLSLCTSSSPNPIVDSFSATFDVYANGTVVPGTMQFTFTDFSFLTNYGASPLSFGAPPACEPPGGACGDGFPGGTSLPGQQMWSDSQGYFVDFVPPTWPPTGLESFNATQTVPISVFGGTTLGLDCVGEPASEGCAPFLFCQYIQCAGGGDAPASSGFITITPMPVKTPEPGVLLLLLCGALFCFIRRQRVADAN